MKNKKSSGPRVFLTPVDVLALLYQVLVGLVVLFGHSDVSLTSFLAWHAAGTVLVLYFCKTVPPGRPGVWGFLREWYPLIVMTFLYLEVGPLVHALFDGSLDAGLTAVDKALFLGGGPALWGYQTLHPPPRWINELFHLGYSVYFFLMPIGGFALWLRAPRREFRTYMFTLSFTYYVHYLLFILLPAHSPRYFLPGLREALPGYGLSNLLKTVVEGNAYPGGSFPSSHVAAAFIVTRAYPYMGRWKTLVFSLTLLLFAGTVWGRYHYVSDLVAGLLMGWLCNRFAPSLESLVERWIHPKGPRRSVRPAER